MTETVKEETKKMLDMGIYLYGKEFQVETDYYLLIYMHSAKLTNSRVVRWVLSLQPYRFQLKAIKGVHNIGADYLSRNEK